MQNRKMIIFLGILTAILCVVGILVLFADAFAEINSLPASRGSVFYVMFGDEAAHYASVPGLVAAFVMLCVAIFFALVGAILPGKLGMIPFALTAVLCIVSGILFALGKDLYLSANSTVVSYKANELANGTGLVLGMIFSFLPALLSLYCAYNDFKA